MENYRRVVIFRLFIIASDTVDFWHILLNLRCADSPVLLLTMVPQLRQLITAWFVLCFCCAIVLVWFALCCCFEFMRRLVFLCLCRSLRLSRSIRRYFNTKVWLCASVFAIFVLYRLSTLVDRGFLSRFEVTGWSGSWIIL